MLEAEMDGMTVYNSELRSAMLLSGTTSVTPLWETMKIEQLGYEMERYSKKSSVVQMMKLMLEKYVA
jgi:hypothetical protein